jgi:hypothetical protein
LATSNESSLCDKPTEVEEAIKKEKEEEEPKKKKPRKETKEEKALEDVAVASTEDAAKGEASEILEKADTSVDKEEKLEAYY